MAVTKIDKMQNRIDQLTQTNSELSMSVMNMRQMYEGQVQEKQILSGQVASMQSMLTAVIFQARGKSVTIRAKTMEKLEDYAGISTNQEGDTVVLALLTAEELAEQQQEFDDAEEEDSE